jgi:hypothetical protein
MFTSLNLWDVLAYSGEYKSFHVWYKAFPLACHYISAGRTKGLITIDININLTAANLGILLLLAMTKTNSMV